MKMSNSFILNRRVPLGWKCEGATRLTPSESGFQFNQYQHASEVKFSIHDELGKVWIAYLNSTVVFLMKMNSISLNFLKSSRVSS